MSAFDKAWAERQREHLEAVPLPEFVRFDRLPKEANMFFRCPCSPEESRGGYVQVTNDSSSVLAVCERCGTMVQLRACRIAPEKKEE